ncbi:MAG: ABC transporter substrate-binding protein [Actinomycetota bacterium]|nr:ABC transporter substrate-binding protein [Actinomycetota bacterium]
MSATGVNIAYLIPKTGAAPLPPQVEDGIQAYWKFLNGKGGVLGRTVTVTVYDTTSTDSGARTAAQQAVDAGAFMVVALDRLGVQGTIAKYLDGRHVPNIEVQTPVDLPSSMSWTFGVTIDHRVQGKVIADYMAHALKVHKVGVVYETDSTLQPGVDAFTAEAKAQGLQVVHSQQINGMDNQFLAEAQKLAADKAEATWLYMAPTPAANIAKESESDGYKPIWFANSISWNFNIGLTGGGTAFKGARAFSPWPALGDSRLSTYNGYAPAGPPTVQDFGIPGWGIGQIVANGLLSAGKNLGQNGFRNAMEHLRLTTQSPVDGTPLLWSPLSFAPGVRTGATDVITFVQKGSGTNTDSQWADEADYRSSY